MTSLIEELQRDAINQSTSTSELLRKALLVASKLNANEFSAWVKLELKGYDQNTEAPLYRIIYGNVLAKNPYHGWIPITLSPPILMDLLQTYKAKQSIVEIETIIQAEKEKPNGILVIEIPSELSNNIEWSNPVCREFPIALHLDTTRLRTICEVVRTAVLEWSLKLEQDGVKGDGMSFSSEEKKIASSHTFNVHNYIENMDSSQIQQGTINSSQVMHNHEMDLSAVDGFIKELRESIDDLNLTPHDQAIVESDVATIETQLKSPAPKESTIKECINSTRTVLEATAAGLLTTGLVNHGDKIPFLLESIHRLILHT